MVLIGHQSNIYDWSIMEYNCGAWVCNVVYGGECTGILTYSIPSRHVIVGAPCTSWDKINGSLERVLCDNGVSFVQICKDS